MNARQLHKVRHSISKLAIVVMLVILGFALSKHDYLLEATAIISIVASLVSLTARPKRRVVRRPTNRKRQP
jgi:4-amino-4-deoxy-L-arabinose transferase-like glycosyltransferase